MTSATSYHPYNWEGWLIEYKPKIRIILDWDILIRTPPATGIHLLGEDEEVYSTNMIEGNFWSGMPQVLRPGKKLVLVRAPALKVGERFMLLDGNHRIRELDARIVVLDWIEPKPRELSAFVNLVNPFWSEHGNEPVRSDGN